MGTTPCASVICSTETRQGRSWSSQSIAIAPPSGQRGYKNATGLIAALLEFAISAT